MSARALPLARALVTRGHTVTMIMPPWDNPTDAGKRWVDDGVSVINVGLPPHIPLVWYGMMTRDLLNEVDRTKPDVVHAFKPKGFSGAVAHMLLMRRRGSSPRIIVDTDDWEGADGWNEREAYPWWQQRVFAIQERHLLRNADVITAASRTLEEMTVKVRETSYGVSYVPNGSTGPFRQPDDSRVTALRQELGLTECSVLLIYTRFVECSPERMLALLQAIAETGARPTVVLIGTGLHGEEQTFIAQATASGLPLRIVPVGWVDYASLPDYLALADTAVFPIEDTLLNRSKCPARLVDLLSAGVPVVGEAVGQVGEYIVDGESGLLVAPGHLNGLATTTVDLLQDTVLQTKLQTGAQARIESTYRWDLLAADLEAAYQL